MSEWLAALMFVGTFGLLLLGFPVAFTLGGSAMLFGGLGWLLGAFDASFLSALPERLYGLMRAETLVAIPLFVLMGTILERSKLSDDLLIAMARLFGGLPGGLGISVALVGGLLAASTGIVGATVVTMGLISLPTMLRKNYSPVISSGIVAASGTLGQIIPPSIVLIVLGLEVSSAYQTAQLKSGNFSPETVSVGDLFLGALVPGVLLMFLYALFVLIVAIARPGSMPALPASERGSLRDPKYRRELVTALAPPLALIIGVLGSILFGIATPTEAASVGVFGAAALAYFYKDANKEDFHQAAEGALSVTSMVFMILIGASLFSLVFRGFEGDEQVAAFLRNVTTNPDQQFLIVMLLIFFLGFFLDFFEIVFVVIPIVGPVLLASGMDPLWFGVMVALNLQTSFLTPPFGFSLFYLRGAAPKSITTGQIYQGAVPFILIQILLIAVVWWVPELVTELPKWAFGTDFSSAGGMNFDFEY
jgi:tripartite ATP-independent transporter DctM subunit